MSLSNPTSLARPQTGQVFLEVIYTNPPLTAHAPGKIGQFLAISYGRMTQKKPESAIQPIRLLMAINAGGI